MIDDQILKSSEIILKATSDHNPYATVALFSGGSDSLLMLELIKILNTKPPDFIIHINTRTGLPQTTEYVREYCKTYNSVYVEADSGNAYEDYVLRKGFFGVGNSAHEYSYHVLKESVLGKALSRHIRKNKRNRKILLFNGIRIEESENRKKNFGINEIQIYDRRVNNVWVNVVHWWKEKEKNLFIDGSGAKKNPVSIAIGRSGECMCGTMQSTLDRISAKKYCPAWGKWLDDLEKRVIANGFPWKWGENINKGHLMERDGQMNMFLPMCVGCKALE